MTSTKKVNKQLIKDVLKLTRGIFRINGVFEDKARVCSFVVTTKFVYVYPLNIELPVQMIDRTKFERNLSNGDINIMCLERF